MRVAKQGKNLPASKETDIALIGSFLDDMGRLDSSNGQITRRLATVI
jgi:hypothetical protein